MTLSGWCSPSPGCRHTHTEHTACTSARCQCEAFGGHGTPVVERDSARGVVAIEVPPWDNGGTTKAAPGGASTPLIQGPRRPSKEID